MFLKRFVFVNWGNIPNLEFELGPVNLLAPERPPAPTPSRR